MIFPMEMLTLLSLLEGSAYTPLPGGRPEDLHFDRPIPKSKEKRWG
jgi:hypothetical protein